MIADREELARYREALASFHAVDAEAACPPPDRIWEAARGELRPPQVAELADHTLACSDCFMAWRLAVEIERTPEETVRFERPVVASWRRQAWGGLLAAAAAILLVVAVPWQDLGERPPSSVTRGEDSGQLESKIPDGALLPRESCVLRWSSPWPEATYLVRIQNEDTDTLHEMPGLRSPEYRVPEETFDSLPAGAGFWWYVEAETPDGRRTERVFKSFLE